MLFFILLFIVALILIVSKKYLKPKLFKLLIILFILSFLLTILIQMINDPIFSKLLKGDITNFNIEIKEYLNNLGNYIWGIIGFPIALMTLVYFLFDDDTGGESKK